MSRIPALSTKESSAEAWQRKAAFIVNLLRGAIDRAGPTADRPTDAYIGFRYFDTTLDRPIWMGDSGWVTADGSAA